MEKKMNNKGFSLVELIVVIAIMAVLVGVLAPQFIKYVEKSREATDIQNCDTIKSVVESYYADKETLPQKVIVTINGTNTSATKEDGSTKENAGLADAGVDKNKIKAKNWTSITMTYSTSDGKWEYVITNASGKKPYYKVNSDKSAFEVE